MGVLEKSDKINRIKPTFKKLLNKTDRGSVLTITMPFSWMAQLRQILTDQNYVIGYKSDVTMFNSQNRPYIPITNQC